MQRKEKKNAYMPHYFHGKQTNGQNKIRYGGEKMARRKQQNVDSDFSRIWKPDGLVLQCSKMSIIHMLILFLIFLFNFIV